MIIHGELTYTLDNSETHTVYREFQKNKCKITNKNLDDISKKYSIDKNKGNLFFVEETRNR